MKSLLFILFFLSSFYCYSQNIKVSATGDIMAHDNLQYYALASENGYETLFEPVKDIFLSDDITIANFETPVSDEIGVKNFPYFNANTSLVKAIKKSGIEVISLANNHSFDQREKGIISTIDAVKKENLIYSGMGLNPKDAKKTAIFNCKGVIIGFLSATFSVNGISMTEKNDKPYVNLVLMEDDKKFDEFCGEIRDAKKKVDFLIVAYHSGTEYNRFPSDTQTKCLKKIADSGADVVLGHHPHVLQKIEYYNTSDSRKVLIAYSLGNLISGQSNYLHQYKNKNSALYEENFTKTAEGVILQFEINRWNDKFYISNANVIPLFNLRYIVRINNKNYSAFKTELIKNILNIDEKESSIENISIIKDMVKYRLEKMKELIKIPFNM